MGMQQVYTVSESRNVSIIKAVLIFAILIHQDYVLVSVLDIGNWFTYLHFRTCKS